MVHGMACPAQPADDLCEVVGYDQRHRGEHRSGEPRERPVQDLEDALPPRREVLEVHAQRWRRHPLEAEADQLWIADDAARQPAVQLVGDLGLSTTEGPVDPDQHPTTSPPISPDELLTRDARGVSARVPVQRFVPSVAAATPRASRYGPGRSPELVRGQWCGPGGSAPLSGQGGGSQEGREEQDGPPPVAPGGRDVHVAAGSSVDHTTSAVLPGREEPRHTRGLDGSARGPRLASAGGARFGNGWGVGVGTAQAHGGTVGTDRRDRAQGPPEK